MKQILFLLFTILFFSQSVFSQTLLKGKVISDASNLDGIYVTNLTNEKSTMTEKGGFFSIFAKATDTLMFSGMQIKGMQIILKQSDFSESLFFMRLKQQITMLDEVYIKDYSRINAFSLGIIPFGTKKYTPAQRKLRTATAPFVDLSAGGMAGGSVGVDPLINWLSGRTAMLKKELEVENKERLQIKIDNLYDEDFFIKTLKIPSEYIKGFQVYVIDDQRLINSIKSKNKIMTTFLLGELAEKYKQITFLKKE
ncbi:hypothetical protein SAMN05660845_0563 [Flavobacterium swingsii]|jgi:hypothetical protein|uniref:CarboxypepD_reg-like domain-containing protein n=1 Tax=Flavobacterium swingsii TaxID=498292 RepID=A0A1I0VSM9_9FLAO|nr:hypothetical protein [Flavobacterium swingsii]SFA79238.1 hypothetical protein SAMN05660845_0563 [Flavobacterium swingsii]